MNILIVGAGSLGLLFAGKLAGVSSADVRVITRTAEQARKINGSGLTLIEDNREARKDLSCFPFEEAAPLEPWDWIFLMMKQTHLNAPLIRYVTGMMMDHTKLLCFQNGVGHVERLTEAGIPRRRIYFAVTTEGAKREAGNVVRHTGHGTTSIGSAQEGEHPDEMRRLSDLFNEIGLHSDQPPSIHAVVWRKLLINSVINPLTSIMNIRNGELLDSPYSLKLMEALYEEACDVLKEVGLPISEALWEALLEVCRKTSANSSSMQQDLRAGRETEIDWINGSIIRLAAEQGRKVPTHETVYHMVKGLEQLQ